MLLREWIGIVFALLGAVALVAGIRIATAFFTGTFPGAALATAGGVLLACGVWLGRSSAAQRLDMSEAG